MGVTSFLKSIWICKESASELAKEAESTFEEVKEARHLISTMPLSSPMNP